MKKALFIVLLACIGLSAMAQITLSFNPQKGSKYEYRTDMTQKINQEVMGQKMNIDQTMVFTYDMDVVGKTGSEFTIDFMFKEIALNLASPMMSMSYDSKSTVAPTGNMDQMIAKMLGALLNKKFTAVVMTDGTVKSVVGMEAIINDMMKAVSGDMMMQQMGQEISKQLSDNGMKESFQTTFKIYPGKPVKPGDSWTVLQKTASGGPMAANINTTFTLKSISGNVAHADVKSTIDAANGQLSGTQEGTAEFDIKSGLPLASKAVQKLSGKFSTNGMEIPMDITSNVNISVKKVK